MEGSQKKKDGKGDVTKSSKKRKHHAESPVKPPIVDGATLSVATKSVDTSNETWSKSKKKRMRMMLAKRNKDAADEPTKKPKESFNDRGTEQIDEDESQRPRKASKLQSAFEARLSGSRFRILNEELYTKTSEESFERFSKNPELFSQYHEGFRHQVESWPMNPVDVIVRWLATKYNNNNSKNKKNQSDCVVADFGCGDAQLARDLLKIKRQDGGQNRESRFTVHSFDLVAPNELVTACDMARVPLPDKSVNVCVFCLSLMGTNLADFIREAHRVLKDDGIVKIAEVRSRIEYSHSKSSSSSSGGGKGKDTKNDSTTTTTTKQTAGTLGEFLDVLKALGFHCTKKDLSNKMFLMLDLEKTGKVPDKKLSFSAKPCIYKRR